MVYNGIAVPYPTPVLGSTNFIEYYQLDRVYRCPSFRQMNEIHARTVRRSSSHLVEV